MYKYLRLLKVNNYIKNILVFIPLFLSGEISDWEKLLNTIIGFISFSMMASAVYIINDSYDRQEDRQHPLKKNRPIASGSISITQAILIASILIIFSLFLIATISMNALYIMFLYVFMNFCYSAYLKKFPIIKKVHQAINDVTNGIERFSFNVCIAKLYELTAQISSLKITQKEDYYLKHYSLSILSQLLSPFAPHHSEEIWLKLGHKGLIANQPWPKAEKRFLKTETKTIGVQINGKLRGTITHNLNDDIKTIENLAISLKTVEISLKGLIPKKIIVIPGRIVNIVI